MCMCVCVHVLVTHSCPTLSPHGLQSARLLCPRDSPGKNTGVGCHFLLWDLCICIGVTKSLFQGFRGGSVAKNMPPKARDRGSIPGPGRVRTPRDS